MNPLAILKDLRFQDVLDVLFLCVFSYHLYVWFRGTKALKALVGLLMFGMVFTAARVWGLFLTTWVFQILWQVLVILLIILFQREIRQVLERVNPLQALGIRRLPSTGGWARSLADGVFSLAGVKTGAIIVLEHTDGVDDLVTEGHSLEAEPSSELLRSVFQKESPLHDGAMLIRGGRVAQVASYLPLTSETGLPKQWGTRHRAALGLSERCDAGVIVVSEERGEVSVAQGGEIRRVNDPEALVQWIREAMQLSAGPTPWRQKAKLLVTRRWRTKAAVVGVVCAVWLALAGQQDFEVGLEVPLEVRNLPSGISMEDPVNPRVTVRVRGLRKDASILNEKNVRALLDARGVKDGPMAFHLSRENIQLPNDRVYVVKIDPSRMEFVFRENEKGKE
ncbi:MAG: diadenylate cyclase [Thermodesulfobacteriota bacterium]